MKISKNFDLGEFTKSQIALRNGLDNTLGADHVINIKSLVDNVLQPLRDKVGPVIVNSGFRSLHVNRLLGSSDNSQHTKGEAADIEAVDLDNRKLAAEIQANYDFDQLILECYMPGDPRSGWVHVSYREGNNRKQVLTAYRKDGKMVYEAGLL